MLWFCEIFYGRNIIFVHYFLLLIVINLYFVFYFFFSSRDSTRNVSLSPGLPTRLSVSIHVSIIYLIYNNYIFLYFITLASLYEKAIMFNWTQLNLVLVVCTLTILFSFFIFYLFFFLFILFYFILFYNLFFYLAIIFYKYIYIFYLLFATKHLYIFYYILSVLMFMHAMYFFLERLEGLHFQRLTLAGFSAPVIYINILICIICASINKYILYFYLVLASLTEKANMFIESILIFYLFII